MVLRPASIEAVIEAVKLVHERLLRSTAALEKAAIPYAVIGANAVAEWVCRIEDGAERNTPNVDLLIYRHDFDRVRIALQGAGFVSANIPDRNVFLDGPEGSVRSAVQVFFSLEKIKPDYSEAAPDLNRSEYETNGRYRVLLLDELVRMKLTSYRTIDRVHLRDLMDVGAIDGSWPARFDPLFASRLQELLDDPDG